MALSPLQQRVAALVAGLAESQGFALAGGSGLAARRDREAEAFVRLAIEDGEGACEVDIAIDYRCLDPVQTPYGAALDLRELGANKVLAIFDRAAPRDFLDLAELTKLFSLKELVALAAEKDSGLDLEVLYHAMGRLDRVPPARLGLDDHGFRDLRATVAEWQKEIERLRDQALGFDASREDRG